MNTNNVLLGILIVVIVLLGGWFLFMTPTAPTATTTTTVTSVTQTGDTPGVPSVTTDAASGVSNSTAIVTGKVTPNGSQTTYWYEYGTSEALGSNTVPQAVGSGFISIATPAYITGLTQNTKYFYRLSAKNGYGTVNGQIQSLVTNTTPPTPGSAPTTHSDSATDVARTTANIHGTVNPNGVDSWYWFEWGTTNDLGNAAALQSAGAGSGVQAVDLSLSGLHPATKYYFRLNAQNKYGTVTGAILSFTTTGPPAATAPSATTNAATTVLATGATLNAHVNPDGAETTYWFEYASDSLLSNIIGNGTPHKSAGNGTDNVAVSSTVNGLARNTTYYFRVVAQNSEGTTRGDAQSFTTKP